MIGVRYFIEKLFLHWRYIFLEFLFIYVKYFTDNFHIFLLFVIVVNFVESVMKVVKFIIKYKLKFQNTFIIHLHQLVDF